MAWYQTGCNNKPSSEPMIGWYIITILPFKIHSNLFRGWVGLWGFLWWAPSAKRKDYHGVSSGWSSVWHPSNTGLSSTQYEQIPIILGVSPFWLTPFVFLYARLKNGRIMLWQCPSVCPSVRPSFPDFFSTCFEISIWNLVNTFSRWHDMSSLSFITIGSLWPSLQPKVGQTQFLQSWPYKSR